MSVVAPFGFEAAGVSAGIKKPGEKDLAVVAAAGPVAAAGIFTRNRSAAAPVLLSRHHLRDHQARAIVLNSGCANAGTGSAGEKAALAMAQATAEGLGCRVPDVLVASTGPIGPPLPIDSICNAIPDAIGALNDQSGTEAATAIMTTDTVNKEATSVGSGYVIGGMAKGAAMVRPDMATMLAVLTTDAVLSWQALETMLRRVGDKTFNCLNIDGCPSTNDSVFLLASGAAGVRPDLEEFEQRLHDVCLDLALQMARDGEMTDRVITVNVRGAVNDAIAREIGRTMTDSDLVRASFYGGDPNWGRLLAAAGAGPFPVNPNAMTVSYNGVEVARNSVQLDYARNALLATLRQGDFSVDVEVGTGEGQATIYACDLTPGYVTFNSEPS
ncbi:MAG: bifunctional glutamate N-acetyltransferase/amino-acid acetyltransferase ArgJ [Acidimicrobiia bacterium]|nr:bifunctional glutamate N-acetyltransferase/amino-acid acetyltransferase ArgJ [Acidimicrobiia bacterium]